MRGKTKVLTLAAAFLLLAGAAVSAAGAGKTGGDGVFLRLLGYVPDTSDTRAEVWLNDYVAAARALGLGRPSPEADYQAVVDYAQRLLVEARMLKGPYISGFDSYALMTLEVLRSRAGYDLRDITASVVAGQPPARYSALLLEVPAEQVRESLLQAKDLPAPQVGEYRGVALLSWGDDFSVDPDRRLEPPAYDQLGRGANLAFPEGAIFYTLWTDGVRGMIDASQGEIPSLAGVEEYALLARALEELGVYSAWLSDRTQSVDYLEDETHCRTLLRPYLAFATGIGRDEGGFFMGLVLVHSTPEEAGKNAAWLPERLGSCWTLHSQRPWGEYFDLDRLAIEREGRTLMAKLYFTTQGAHPMWVQWLLYRDPLLLHEEAGP